MLHDMALDGGQEITSSGFAFSTENYTKGIFSKLLCSDCLETS